MYSHKYGPGARKAATLFFYDDDDDDDDNVDDVDGSDSNSLYNTRV